MDTVNAEVVTTQSVGSQMKEMLSPATNVAASVQIAAQQAAIQIACQVMAAQATPRNEAAIRVEFLQRAQDINFAESAFYAVPRGNRDDDEDEKKEEKKEKPDNKVKGPSVHLAREILARWQHLNVEVTDHGSYPGSDGKRYSDVEIQSWDIQNNSRFTKKFKVAHWRHTRKGGYPVNGNQVDEIVGAASAKQERNAILKFIPRSFILELQKQCEATVAASFANQATIDNMLATFSKKFGVTQIHLEQYIGKPLGKWEREDLVEMGGVCAALKLGEQKVSDYFDLGSPEPAPEKPADKPAGKSTAKKSNSKPEPAQDTAAETAKENSPASPSVNASANVSVTSSPDPVTPGNKPAPPPLDTGADVLFNV